MKVLHIITGLGMGGAETMLCKLLAQFRDDGGPAGEVICLAPPGTTAPRIEALGVHVTSLGMAPGLRGGLGGVAAFGRLKRLIARARPDVVQTWMYHANLIGGLAAIRAARAPVIWGLRQSNLDPASSKRSTILTARAGAWLSARVPDRIACVSESARRVHAAMGYAEDRMVVLPNGFDLDRFRPDAAARGAVRAELGIPEDAPLVGLAARFDPQKDHAGFLDAARRVTGERPDTVFLLCGEGASPDNAPLTRMVADVGLGGSVRLLGARDDMARITAALDIAVSSSAYGEGFSNAIGEALATSVPVVTTDVGDSAAIVGDAGRVVPPSDPAALAVAIADLIRLPAEVRADLGARGRAGMAAYSLPAIAGRYRALYESVLTARAAGAAGAAPRGAA